MPDAIVTPMPAAPAGAAPVVTPPPAAAVPPEGTPAPVVTPPAVTPPVVEPPSVLDLTPQAVPVTPTGNQGFDAVGQMLGEKGIANANTIMAEFAETGTISIQAKADIMSGLGENLGIMAINQLEGTAKTMNESAKAANQIVLDYANGKFNGEDASLTWNQIQEYAKSPEAGFTAADRAAMNAMLANGGLQAQLVIDKIFEVYNADPTVSTPGTLLEGDTGLNGITFDPLSRVDYTTELRAAVSKYGEDSYQVEQLNRRRTLSMQRGI